MDEQMKQFLARVGLGVFQIAASTAMHGWAKPQYGAPYVHLDDKPHPAWDLVMWCAGDAEAEERMRLVAAEWTPILQRVIAESTADLAERRAS